MLLPSLFRSRRAAVRAAARRDSHGFGTRKRPPRVPLYLERLEDRTVPSTVNWDGGGGDYNWNNALNWDTDTLPGASDDVQISSTYAGTTITSGRDVTIHSVSSAASLSITSGTFSVSADSSVSNGFTNAGTVNVLAGTLTLGSGSDSGHYHYTGTAVAALTFVGGHTFAASPDSDPVGIDTDGGVTFANTSYYTSFGQTNADGGDYTIAGSYRAATFTQIHTGENHTVYFTGTVSSVGQELDVDHVGNASFGGNSFATTNLNLTGGGLTNATVTVAGQFNWVRGTVVNTTLTVLPGCTFSLSGDYDRSFYLCTLNNYGACTYTNRFDTNFGLFGSNDEFNNYGSIDLEGHGRFFGGVGIGHLNNYGTINVHTGLALTDGGEMVNNFGTVEVYDGHPYLSNIYVQSAGSTVLAGGNLSAADVTLLGGVLTGSGFIEASIHNLGGQVNPGGTGTLGQMVLDRNYDQGPNGVLNIEINPETGQFDQFSMAEYRFSAFLDGTLNIIPLASSLPPIGDYNLAPGFDFLHAPVVGAFATVNQPVTLNGEFYSPIYSSNTVLLLPTVTSASLQAAINGAPVNSSFTFQANSDGAAQIVLQAVNGLGAQSNSPTVVLNLAPNTTYADEDVAVPAGVTLVINGDGGTTTIVGNSPALRVRSGNVIVRGVILQTATDSPTIVVSGGSLTLRNCTVQESTGYADSAISLTGGTLDLGTATSPGNNVINVNGSGDLLHNTTSNIVSASGTTLQSNGTALSTGSLSSTILTTSAAVALLNQPVTFTATVSGDVAGGVTPTGTVEFVDLSTNTSLGTISLSSGSASLTLSTLATGNHRIAAKYSGDATYLASLDSVSQSVRYTFSGFLAPLNANIALATNRTVPIKFQLTDYNKKFISVLSAVASLTVLNSSNQNVLTNAGSTALRYDSSANQFVTNWQTKGLAAGTYTVKLTLADGAVYSKTVQLSPNGSTAGLMVDGSVTTTATGALLGGDIELYVDNSNGDLTADELARIQDAMNAVDAVTEPYGVKVEEVTDSTLADVTLNMDTTSAVGGYADGVLGCTTDAGEITLIQGWNWYAGSSTSGIGSGQYDFETVVVHELGHALGLGHSSDGTSVMYATLNTGAVRRSLASADLNVPGDGDPADGLHVAAVVERIGNPSCADAGRIGNASYENGRDLLFALVGTAPDGLPLGSRPLRGWSGEPSRTADGMPGDQAFALSGSNLATPISSPLFAGRLPRQQDGPLFDVPLLPEPGQDGRGDGNPSDGCGSEPVDGAGDYLVADTARLDD